MNDKHPLTETAAKVTEEMIEAGASYAWEEVGPGGLSWNSLTERHKEGCRRDARNVLSAAFAVEPLARTLLGVPEGYGAPHHDAGKIEPDDFVMQVDSDGCIRAGRAHHQGEHGDWQVEYGRYLTWAARRADRPDALTVWPAPAPPAVEVEWEPQFGDIIMLVEVSGVHFPKLVFDGSRWCSHGARIESEALTAFTLPVGIRVRRDGEHKNGEPRFVKVQEEGK